MRKNSNKSFYHFSSILFDEDTGEELEKKYFMTLKEMADAFQVHPSSLGKVIRYKKSLKKIPNVIFKRVYEPVLLQVPNELVPPKVAFYVEEIDTQPNQPKVSEKNQQYNFYEEKKEQYKQSNNENEEQVTVSLLNDNSLDHIINNEFDNELLVNMNLKSKQKKNNKRSQNKNNDANVNIKLVNELDNIFLENYNQNHNNTIIYSEEEQPKPNSIEEQPKPNSIEEQPKPNSIEEQPKPNSIEEQPKQITIKPTNAKQYRKTNTISTICRLNNTKPIANEEVIVTQNNNNQITNIQLVQNKKRNHQVAKIELVKNNTHAKQLVTDKRSSQLVKEDIMFYEDATNNDIDLENYNYLEEDKRSSHKLSNSVDGDDKDLVFYENASNNDISLENYIKEQLKLQHKQKVIANNLATDDFDFFQDANSLDTYYVNDI